MTTAIRALGVLAADLAPGDWLVNVAGQPLGRELVRGLAARDGRRLVDLGGWGLSVDPAARCAIVRGAAT